MLLARRHELLCQPSGVASYMALSCLSSRYATEDLTTKNSEWIVGIAKEDSVNHRRTTSRNGQGSQCRQCCASRMTEVDGSRQSEGIYRSTPATPGLLLKNRSACLINISSFLGKTNGVFPLCHSLRPPSLVRSSSFSVRRHPLQSERLKYFENHLT